MRHKPLKKVNQQDSRVRTPSEMPKYKLIADKGQLKLMMYVVVTTKLSDDTTTIGSEWVDVDEFVW
jgi:hypothetical protein